jgi:hypothetical protein
MNFFFISCVVIAIGIVVFLVAEANCYFLDGFWAALLAFLMAAAIVAVILCPMVRSDFSSECKEKQQEYEELMLYKDLVEESDSERVRYDFYKKVENWNTRYHNAARLAEDEQFQNWFGMYWCNYYYGTGPIEFELKGE